jgi:spore coat polysaccharide biosynthesis protein SpsF (cytidylyltransferase family)
MIGLIIQARSRSARFPNKIMADLCGKPIIEHVIQRCAAAKIPELVVVAMPKEDFTDRDHGPLPVGERVRKIAAKHRAEVYAPETPLGTDDVLTRFYKTACHYHMNQIVRVTGDCPLIDPAIIDRCLMEFMVNRNAIEYVTNSILRIHPRGMDVEVFSFNALEQACYKACLEDNAAFDQEHVTPYIRRNPKTYLLCDLGVNPIMEGMDLRLCVDYPEDLELIRAVYKACTKQGHNSAIPEGVQKQNPHITGQYPMFGVCEIKKAYEANPTWININGKYRQAG